MSLSKKVLIVPLDWGLGHATRCMPLIQFFIDAGCDVSIGGNKKTNALLKQEFPACTFLYFQGYDMEYSQSASGFLLKMMAQTPKMLGRIIKEKRQLKAYMHQHKFDIILSDNRFGLRAKGASNIFMTHQLNVLLPQSRLLQRLTNWMNHLFIKRFDYVVVPDYANQLMSGELTSTVSFKEKKPLNYLGNLSRLKRLDGITPSKKILVILSGPEPQRSMLEEKIVAQAQDLDEQFVILQAKPEVQAQTIKNNIAFISHLDSTKLAQQLLQADIIISRTGYSTVMDLIKLALDAILIPTPGQTEQEYLGDYYAKQHLFQIEEQATFDLKKALEVYRANHLAPRPKVDNDLYKLVLAKIMKEI